MASNEFNQLENWLKTLSNKGNLSLSKKQAIRDQVFRNIGQIELADAIAEGEEKASDLIVSLNSLKKALIPHRLSFSIPVTLAMVMTIFLGSIVTGAVAQNARPGDPTFIIRKALEAVELAVVTNPVKKAEVSLDIANQRIQDLEESYGKEQALNVVLKESKTAIQSARATIKKVTEKGDETSVIALVDKLNSLINDQRLILNDIESETTDEELKKTVIAIRDEIDDDLTDSVTKEIITEENDNTVVAVAPSVVVKAVPNNKIDIDLSPTLASDLNGFKTLKGRLGTANGKPVLYFEGNQYIVIEDSPINLNLYIGSTNNSFSGTVINGYMTASRVIINDIVLFDQVSVSYNR